LALRDLLKFEFVFADRARFRDEVVVELELLDPDWRARVSSPIEALSMLADTGLLVAGRCLQALVEAQFVVAERLAAADPSASIDRARLLDECHGVGRQLVLQGRLQHPESASRELFASALDLAASRGLLTSGRERLRAARREWLDEVEDVRARLRVIEGLNISAFEDVLDDIAA
jgi:glycerol-3-phosphate O-acyltransferase